MLDLIRFVDLTDGLAEIAERLLMLFRILGAGGVRLLGVLGQPDQQLAHRAHRLGKSIDHLGGELHELSWDIAYPILLERLQNEIDVNREGEGAVATAPSPQRCGPFTSSRRVLRAAGEGP